MSKNDVTQFIASWKESLRSNETIDTIDEKDAGDTQPSTTITKSEGRPTKSSKNKKIHPWIRCRQIRKIVATQKR
jgi:hypothetical protein